MQTPELYRQLRQELSQLQQEEVSLVQEGAVSRTYAPPRKTTSTTGPWRTWETGLSKPFSLTIPSCTPTMYYAQAAQALREDANGSLETQSN